LAVFSFKFPKMKPSLSIPNRTIWLHSEQPPVVQVIDQRSLPHQVVIADLQTGAEAARAIREMWVRGAPLIGATAAFGVYLAVHEAMEKKDRETFLAKQIERLAQSRPTAVNLQWALDRQEAALAGEKDWSNKKNLALQTALQIVEEDVEICRSIGVHGLELIKQVQAKKPDEPVQILTHCNAGRMATIEWGTATAPIYQAHQAGIPVHVWVDETRPRNQGARITAWELAEAGIPHTVIADNVGGHLMQHGQVDLCLVGTDRTTREGDVANKIGTYLKALAAWDNEVPFYVALPSSTIDWELRNGLTEIPIEQRSADEVHYMQGLDAANNQVSTVRLTPLASKAANYAFDVTPARYVSGLITERGVCQASEAALLSLFPEKDH
jgi:methylthioribose-1-phosphate isomerase